MILSAALLAVHLSGNINLGELIVGVGTLALAVITWRLARATGASVAAAEVSAKAAQDGAAATKESAEAARDGVEAARVSAKAAQDGVAAAQESADAARDSAEAERESVEAMAMPYVIAVPREVGAEINFVPGRTKKLVGTREVELVGTLMLGLWNLGSGPGLVSEVRLICRRKPLLLDLTRWITLGAGNQFLDANMDATSWPTAPKNEKTVAATLRIEYLHSNGRSYRTDSDVEIEGNELRCLTFRRSLAGEPGGG